jgi:hypothetical protein
LHPIVSLGMYSIARLLLDEWHLRGDKLGFIENTVDCIINTYCNCFEICRAPRCLLTR